MNDIIIPEGCTLVPFALMAWDDGLDYDVDGNAWQDSPPCEYVFTAHQTRDSAEKELQRMQGLCPKSHFWLQENHICPDYEVEDPSKWK